MDFESYCTEHTQHESDCEDCSFERILNFFTFNTRTTKKEKKLIEIGKNKVTVQMPYRFSFDVSLPQDSVESRLHISPSSHVFRLFLTPHKFSWTKWKKKARRRTKLKKWKENIVWKDEIERRTESWNKIKEHRSVSMKIAWEVE